MILGRKIREVEFLIRQASVKARFAKRVFYYCKAESMEKHRELILKENDGAWPIGLKLVGQ